MKYIGIDFDGTCVKHEYPKVGADIGAQSTLRDLVECGNKLILFTMRSGKELNDAVNWFKQNNIKLYGIQTNPTQKRWTNSPKAYAHLYIDDAALGCPLITGDGRDYVDWIKVREYLIDNDYLPNKGKIIINDDMKYLINAELERNNNYIELNIYNETIDVKIGGAILTKHEIKLNIDPNYSQYINSNLELCFLAEGVKAARLALLVNNKTK